MRLAPPVRTVAPTSDIPVRFHGLDTLRGFAAVLVVFLHAGVPYMTNPLPHLLWPARDVHPSSHVDAVTWCTECFLMPLFFVLAGFFSEGLLISRGHRAFLAGRTKRLLGSMLAAGLVVLPICLVVWILGWVGDGLYLPGRRPILGLPPELSSELYGVCHLWFLQHLYLYCVGLCGLHWLGKRFYRLPEGSPCLAGRSIRALNGACVCAVKPLLPAIPCALVLYWDPRIVLGFYQGFFPVVSKLIYYAIYFFAGVMMYRQREQLRLHTLYGNRYLLTGGAIFCILLPMIHEHTNRALTGLRLAQMAGLLALFACFTTFGLLATFLRARNGNNAITRYLAQASFWVYLVHLPFVALAQIAIVHLPVPTVCKFLLAGLIAMALALMTYQVGVRDTWLGDFLNGSRRPRKFTTKSAALSNCEQNAVGARARAA